MNGSGMTGVRTVWFSAWILGLALFPAILVSCRTKPLSPETVGWARAIASHYGVRTWMSSRARFLRYDVVVMRDGMAPVTFRELIDRGTGEYRFEADAREFGDVVGREGLPAGRLVALGNREVRIGTVWIGGVRQPAALIRSVRERVDYDSWWITFPLDMGSPDINVEDHGAGPQASQHLVVRFPEGFDDVYHLFVDPATLMIRRTELHFPDGVMEGADWHEPVTLNRMTIQLERRLRDRTLRFTNVALTAGIRSGTLRDPGAEMHDAR